MTAKKTATKASLAPAEELKKKTPAKAAADAPAKRRAALRRPTGAPPPAGSLQPLAASGACHRPPAVLGGD